jgi:tetratricopeptide (TPR) repeat protein
MAAVLAGCCLVAGGAMVETAAPAASASGASTATAPGKLTNAYPLGPQRLCCNGQSGSSGQTGSTGQTGSRPPAGTSPARTRPAGQPVGRNTSSGGSVLLIVVGLVATLLVAGVAAVYRTQRRPTAVPDPGSRPGAPVAGSNVTDTSTSLAGGRAPGSGASRDLPLSPSAATPESEERDYRRLDANGDAVGAFNLGVLLHQRGDVAGAIAAYERAEQRGDPDAAFNLGVLMYETGDFDGAEAWWRRSADRGHARAAANLVFLSSRRGGVDTGADVDSDVGSRPETPRLADFEELVYRRADESGASTGAFNLGVMLHEQGDAAGAIAAYERAEQRGSPDAAFNLGVLLYELGDLDGAEAAWRRSVEHGHARAAANLEFLLSHRHDLDTAPSSGGAGDER